MKILKVCTKRLNLNISPVTFDAIEEIANEDGRKPGNLARIILDDWVKAKKSKNNLAQKKKFEK
jgi:hypothetical protein